MLKKLFWGALLGAALQTPASAIVYTWGGTGSGPESSTYPPASATVTFDNFQLDWSGSQWSTYSGAAAGSVTLQGATGGYTITNQNVVINSAPVGYQNNSQGFTISNANDLGQWVTFLLNPAASVAFSPDQVVYIYAIGNITNLASDASPGYNNGVNLNTFISGVSAPGLLGLMTLVPFSNLILKRRLATKRSVPQVA